MQALPASFLFIGIILHLQTGMKYQPDIFNRIPVYFFNASEEIADQVIEYTV